MKSLLMFLTATTLSFAAFAQKSKANTTTNSKTTVLVQYTCPMHPDVVSDKAGKCSRCGMDLSLSKKEQMKRDVMKTYTCPMHSEIVSDHAGKCPKCKAQFVVDRQGSKQGNKVYTCSMHADESSDKPGKCSICGMDLTKTKEKSKSKKG